MRTGVPITRAPLSRPKHLPSVPPSVTAAPRVGFQHMRLGDTTFRPWHCCASLSWGPVSPRPPVGCFREFILKVDCRKDPGEQTLRTGLWSWRNHKPASDECPVLTVSGVLIKASDIF